MTIKNLTKSVQDFTFVINLKKSQGKDFFNFFKPNSCIGTILLLSDTIKLVKVYVVPF